MKTTEHEPVSAADALRQSLGGSQSLAIYLETYATERRNDFENTWELGICKKCGISLGDTDEDKIIRIGAWGFLPNVICEGCAIAGKADLKAKERAERDKAYAAFIPVEFNVWDEKKGNGGLLAKVNQVFSFASRKGLVIHGVTGSCKTRVAWQLIKRIVDQPEAFTWAFLDAFECATKGFPDNAGKVDYLVIDDLGNEPMSQKYEATLLHLIRRRCDWHKPVIVTTQLTARMFKEKYFNGSAAEAVMRRLRDRTESIDSG